MKRIKRATYLDDHQLEFLHYLFNQCKMKKNVIGISPFELNVLNIILGKVLKEIEFRNKNNS